MKHVSVICLLVLSLLAASPASVRAAEGAPEFAGIEAAQLRGDVAAVVAAFVLRLKGNDEAFVAKKLKIKGASVIQEEDGFKYEGFHVLSTQIISLDKIEVPDADTRMSARLVLGDRLHRGTVIAVMADYKTEDKGLTLIRANWTPLFPKQPRTQMLVVPTDKIIGVIKAASETYAGLYTAAAAFSIPMRDMASTSEEKGDYTIFVFVQDRIAPDAKLEVKISDEPKMKDKPFGYGDATRYAVYDGGWPVAVISGSLPLAKGKNVEMFVKAVYEPGLHVSRNNEEPELIGLWSTAPQ